MLSCDMILGSALELAVELAAAGTSVLAAAGTSVLLSLELSVELSVELSASDEFVFVELELLLSCNSGGYLASILS